MTDSPLLTILLFAGAVCLAKLWLDDYRATEAGQPNPKALPGAFSASAVAIWIGVIGAILLVALETAGEIALGVSTEQSDIAAIFLLAMLGAGILEEILFRGYLVIQTKGKNILILSILGFSLVFALLHYQYYTSTEETGDSLTVTFNLNAKAGWSLLILFLNSLWFYTVRFFKWNPLRSLLPCFAAHIASNAAVFLVKLAQGHVTSLW
ncbi:MAG: type II CAAX prenyl endopeptidase Rce1 family protein [Opitutales bacterium]